MQRASRRQKPPQARKGGPVRWTAYEIVLIVVSLGLIGLPIYTEAYRWVNPASVPAAQRQQEAPTPEPAAETPVPATEVPAADTSVPATEVPAADTPVPATEVPAATATAEPVATSVPEAPRATNTPIPDTPTATNTPGPGTPTALPPTATNTPTPSTPTAIPTATNTPGPGTPTALPPTATNTPVPGTPTAPPPPTPTSTPILGDAPLRVAKSASRTQAAPGETLSFALSVFSNSDARRTVSLRDTIDPQLEIVGVSTNTGSCSSGSNIVNCTGMSIRSGEPGTIEITIRVRATATPGARLNNQATAQDNLNNTAASDRIVIEVAGQTAPTIIGTPVTVLPTNTLLPGQPTATPVPGQPTATPVPGQPTATPPSGGGGGGGGGDGGGGGGGGGGDRDDDDNGNDNAPGGDIVLPPTPVVVDIGVLPPTPVPQGGGGGTQPSPRPRTAVPAGTRTPTATALPNATPTAVSVENVFLRVGSDWGSAFPGQEVNFVIAVRNTAASGDLRDVRISSALPANLELLGATSDRFGDPQRDGGRVSLNIPNLGPGQGVEIALRTRIRVDVAPGTRLVMQAELSYAGLTIPAYSNIVTVLVVGQTAGGPQQAQATLPPTATNTPVPPTATSTAVPPTATSTPVPPTATITPAPGNAQAPAAPAAPVSNAPAASSQLPNTSSGAPIFGIVLLGMTLMVRTIRLHRAQSRI